jgi:hypothetical protein
MVARGPTADQTLAVVSDLALTASSLPAAHTGEHYSAAVATSGGITPLTFVATGLPSGLSINSSTGAISGAPTAAGAASINLTVTDGDGIEVHGTLRLEVSAQAPELTSASETHRTWREAGAGSKHTPVATTFSIGLNMPARLSLVFSKKLAGRLSNRRCVAQTKRNRHKPKCSRTTAAGTVSAAGKAGTTRISFGGRVGPGKKLGPGSYVVTITAHTSAGTSTARTLRFTLA